MPNKYYYFVEDLDITNDNIPDGVLVRQFTINPKTMQYHFKHNSYVSENRLKEILQDIFNTDDRKSKKEILVSNKFINDVKNKHIPVDMIPRVIISKKSHFAHMLKGKNIHVSKLLKDLNKIFSDK